MFSCVAAISRSGQEDWKTSDVVMAKFRFVMAEIEHSLKR